MKILRFSWDFWSMNDGWLMKKIMGDYTTLYILGIVIIQERRIPINHMGFNGMIEGFCGHS